MEQILDVTFENDPLVTGDCTVMAAMYFKSIMKIWNEEALHLPFSFYNSPRTHGAKKTKQIMT